MQLPVEPMCGQNWKSAVLQWIRSASEYFKRSRVLPDNRTVFACYTPEGMILSAAGSDSSSAGHHHTDYPNYEYNGYFTVICNGQGNVEVINGKDPDNEYCGLTDLTNDTASGWSRVPKKLFTPEEIGERSTIYLGALWNREGGYETVLFLEGKQPARMLEAERSINAAPIADLIRMHYEDGSTKYWVGQIYTEGTFYFGRSYLI